MDPKILKQIEQVINKSLLAQERRLEERFATKDDLQKLKEDIIDDMSGVVMSLIDRLDEKKADKTQMNLLDARVNSLETKFSA